MQCEVAEHGACPRPATSPCCTGQGTSGDCWLLAQRSRATNFLVKDYAPVGVKAGAADGGPEPALVALGRAAYRLRRSIRRSTSCSCVCRRLHDGHLNFGGRNYFYDKAKFIQKWDGHANTWYGGGSGLD